MERKLVRIGMQRQRQDRAGRHEILLDTRENGQFRRVGALIEMAREYERHGDTWGVEVAEHLREMEISRYHRTKQPKAKAA